MTVDGYLRKGSLLLVHPRVVALRFSRDVVVWPQRHMEVVLLETLSGDVVKIRGDDMA